MAHKNIQIKKRNDSEWDNLYPFTLSTNVFDSDGTTIESRLNSNKSLIKQYKFENLSNVVTKYIAHRGASLVAPENTLPAVEKAGELGYQGIEIDCTLSKDNVWVLHHDLTVDRMTNGTGNVRDKTLIELKALNIDSGPMAWEYPNLKIPTLEEALEICIKYGVIITLDLKGTLTVSNINSLIQLLESKGLIDSVILSVLDLNYVNEIRNAHPTVAIEYATNTISQSLYDQLSAVGNIVLSVQYGFVTQSIVNSAYERGILISSYTVNDYNVLNNLIKYKTAYIYTDMAIPGGNLI